MSRTGGEPAEEGSGLSRTARTWRVGLMVAAVPVLVFGFSVLFVSVTDHAPRGCDHDHPRAQVRTWWEEAVRQDVSVPGTRYVALSDSADCIRIGIEDPRVQAHVERRLRRLGVPDEVVVYDEGSDRVRGISSGSEDP